MSSQDFLNIPNIFPASLLVFSARLPQRKVLTEMPCRFSFKYSVFVLPTKGVEDIAAFLDLHPVFKSTDLFAELSLHNIDISSAIKPKAGLQTNFSWLTAGTIHKEAPLMQAPTANSWALSCLPILSTALGDPLPQTRGAPLL